MENKTTTTGNGIEVKSSNVKMSIHYLAEVEMYGEKIMRKIRIGRIGPEEEMKELVKQAEEAKGFKKIVMKQITY